MLKFTKFERSENMVQKLSFKVILLDSLRFIFSVFHLHAKFIDYIIIYVM